MQVLARPTGLSPPPAREQRGPRASLSRHLCTCLPSALWGWRQAPARPHNWKGLSPPSPRPTPAAIPVGEPPRLTEGYTWLPKPPVQGSGQARSAGESAPWEPPGSVTPIMPHVLARPVAGNRASAVWSPQPQSSGCLPRNTPSLVTRPPSPAELPGSGLPRDPRRKASLEERERSHGCPSAP